MRAVPAEEVCVLGMFDETGSHHDGLETLSVNRPELDVSQSCRHEDRDGQKADSSVDDFNCVLHQKRC